MASLFLSIKDVREITNLGETAAQGRLAKVRKVKNIPKYEQVNVLEYCEVYRLEVELVLKQLQRKG